MRKTVQALQQSLIQAQGEVDALRWGKHFKMYSLYDQLVHSEIRNRTAKSIIQTLLAVERFERVEKRLPTELTELVPEYLNEIPWDYYWRRTGSLLSDRKRLYPLWYRQGW